MVPVLNISLIQEPKKVPSLNEFSNYAFSISNVAGEEGLLERGHLVDSFTFTHNKTFIHTHALIDTGYSVLISLTKLLHAIILAYFPL